MLIKVENSKPQDVGNKKKSPRSINVSAHGTAVILYAVPAGRMFKGVVSSNTTSTSKYGYFNVNDGGVINLGPAQDKLSIPIILFEGDAVYGDYVSIVGAEYDVTELEGVV